MYYLLNVNIREILFIYIYILHKEKKTITFWNRWEIRGPSKHCGL